jgi:hypothetical protein
MLNKKPFTTLLRLRVILFTRDYVVVIKKILVTQQLRFYRRLPTKNTRCCDGANLLPH